MKLAETVARKAGRFREMVALVVKHAADSPSRRTLLHIYRTLGRPEAQAAEYEIALRIGDAVRTFHLRGADIFVLGEILHERQYDLGGLALPRNAVIVDAGANIGVSVAWLLAHCTQAQVHAFEPEQGAFALLEQNFGQDPRVRLSRAAVGRDDGEVTLFVGAFAATHSIVSPEEGAGGAVQTVPLRRLDSYLDAEGIDSVDLLKLDVEGAELDALRGLGDRLGRVGAVIGEVHERQVNEAAFYRCLTDAGLSIAWKRRFRDGEENGVHGFLATRTA